MRNESLSEHHHDLEALCAALRESVEVSDRVEFADAYRMFERSVLAHLRVEERDVLPAYELANSADAARIRAAHRELRSQLFALGVDAELHHVRADRLEQFLETLRAHAAHEDAGLYPWAAEHFAEPVGVGLAGRIGHTIRTLRRAARFGKTRPTASAALPLHE